jgi:hypothetical protein
MSDHRITWTIERDAVVGKFVCEAPADAECRSYADPKVCSCETYADLEESVVDGQRRWRHLMYDEHGDEVWHEHDRVGTNSCSLLVWFDDLRAEEAYCGDEQPAKDGPIKLVWDFDHYDWQYADQQRADIPEEHGNG